MKKLNVERVLTLDNKEVLTLTEASIILSNIFDEIKEDCHDIIVRGKKYDTIEFKNMLELLDDIAETSDIKVVRMG